MVKSNNTFLQGFFCNVECWLQLIHFKHLIQTNHSLELDYSAEILVAFVDFSPIYQLFYINIRI